MFVIIKMKMENKDIENDNMVENMMKVENINDFLKKEKWVPKRWIEKESIEE